MRKFNDNLVIAKALESSFKLIQERLLSDQFLSNDKIIELVKDAQDQYKLFEATCERLKIEDRELYIVEFPFSE